ncbi:MAG: DUF2147 domain-containing protein [Gammaproteobacteria bacterium]|nr:DUF2147 domain-containing protein [Gammaproteobacteria bacterium]
MHKLLIVACTLLFAQMALADILGKWKTIDDETGQPQSIVEIYQKDGKYFGRVVKTLKKSGNPVCEKCPGERKGKAILSMDIITDMVKKGDVYESGQILDPTKGKIYDCKVWEKDGNLMVRGYVGFFFRTQTWLRAN